MGYSYTTRDGQRVQVDVAAAFDRLAAEFYRVWGLTLHVTDGGGTRTNEEQWKLYNDYLNGGTLAAKPPFSNHEEDGPTGPRALDVHDSGDDAGVTRYGSARANWLRDNAPRFNFDPAGYRFSQTEPWHIEFQGSLDGSNDYAGPSFDQDVQNEQAWLISRGYDLGASGADGLKGPATIAAVKEYQTFLRAYGYTGDIDGEWGAGTQAAHAVFYAKVMGATNGHPSFPLPDGSYFGPEGGPAESVSGWHGHSEELKVWQQRMADRGWGITVDGLYGPVGATEPTGNTADIAGQFQSEKGLKIDKLIGPETWNGAWEFAVTPPSGGGGGDTSTPPAAGTGRNATLDQNSLIPARPTKDVQAFLKVPQTDSWDQATSDATSAFQKSKNIDQDRVWGITCDGFAFPPAGNFGLGIDYSFARPDLGFIASQGVKFVARYLWALTKADGSTNKGLSSAENKAIESKNAEVVLIYEEDGHELAGGSIAGTRVALSAEGHRNRESLPAKPIYFNVDYDATDEELPSILEALRAINSVIGLERTGLYAGYRIIKAAFDAGVITWGMQTYAWSLDADGHIQWDPRAQLRQWSNGQWGDSVDFQWAMAKEYGQHVVTPKPVDPGQPEQPSETVPANRDVLTKFRDWLDGLLGKK